MEKRGRGRVTFSELRCLDVVNICDGKKLGRPMDILFSERAVVEAIVVPAPGGIMNFVRADKEGYVVPWNRIRRIGDDVILVELQSDFFT